MQPISPNIFEHYRMTRNDLFKSNGWHRCHPNVIRHLTSPIKYNCYGQSNAHIVYYQSLNLQHIGWKNVLMIIL